MIILKSHQDTIRYHPIFQEKITVQQYSPEMLEIFLNEI
jgi:hypothetical protein